MEFNDYDSKLVDSSLLDLDPNNPRFLHLLLEEKGPKQRDLQKVLEEEDATLTLLKAIQKEGVRNPIVVKPVNGRYLVLDGNRRTVVLKMLLQKGEKPPKGVSYEQVRVNCVSADTSDAEVEMLKGILQDGQKKWGAFNSAAFTYRLRHVYKFEIADIADRLQLSVKAVKERIHDYQQFEAYSQSMKDHDATRFSYFAEAPKEVVDWISESDENLRNYYALIRPGTPKHKIRSVATKGGLRDFAIVLKNKEALKELLEDPEITIDDALEIATEANILVGAPYLKRLGKLATQLRSLDEQQLALLRHEKQYKVDIAKLQSACEFLLTKLKKDED